MWYIRGELNISIQCGSVVYACFSSTFVTWRGLIVKKRESLFHQQQEDGRRIVTVTLAHWRKITKKTRLAKNMVGSYNFMLQV